MTNQFSKLEIQFIKASLTTKTCEQMAEFLERPIDEVQDKINELSGIIIEKPIKSLHDMEPEDLIDHQKRREQQPYEFYKHRD